MSAVAPGLDELTGLRSSKPTWYAEYRHSADSLTRALGSLDHIAQVLSATGRGAGALCQAVVDATAEHLAAAWVVLVLAEDALPLASPRLVARGPAGAPVRTLDDLPGGVRRSVAAALAHPRVEPGRDDDGAVVVPLVIDGEQAGALVAWVGPSPAVTAGDLSILRIVANQSAVALLSDSLLAGSEALRQHTEELYAEAEQRARDLADRHRELAAAERRLDDAARREAVDLERHRIARELHDSVAQHVLSAGMAIEWCRPEVEHHGEVHQRLGHAKALTREAVERLRAAIHTLSSDHLDEASSRLPELLGRLPEQHRVPGLTVAVRVEGRPAPVPAQAEEALVKIAAECLFNVTRHAGASRCTVRLAYRVDGVRLSVSDDGTGDPELLRRSLRAGAREGAHRGLGNMASRAQEVGAVLRFTRARMGGVRVEVRLPADPAGPGIPRRAAPPGQQDG
ncbi:GAF domain-containing sensor histidine kinase [Klenkia terrae]|uniref:GAF domain-containing sensor histidine kinase n=1 Tax=Klenkia terrae TaxID=1052259 RepID=A0ABU8E6M5_9ACTN|nr:GAF domain-containing sensor histidine kinase [Klenkia terrae]